MLSPPISNLFRRLALNACSPGATSLQPLPVAIRTPRLTFFYKTVVFLGIFQSLPI